MATDLDELTERITKALVHDAYDTNDITTLIDNALRQQATIKHLAEDNQRLTDALAIAGQHIERLEKAETVGHLTQYAEETSY